MSGGKWAGGWTVDDCCEDDSLKRGGRGWPGVRGSHLGEAFMR